MYSKTAQKYPTNVRRLEASADLEISKSALLSLNHHNFSNIEPIYKIIKLMESFLNQLSNF